MGPLIRLLLILILAVGLGACAAKTRIVAFGDVHGDLEATRKALRLAGVIDEQDRWVGGQTVVVQTGDQLDRGDEERAILELFERLGVEARASGGGFHALLGNHELMNVRGDFRYVTDGGYVDFSDVPYDTADSLLMALEPRQRPRRAAFMPGGPYASMLAGRDVIAELHGNVFVHGGVLPGHVAYGLKRINEEARAWLRGEGARPAVLVGSESPQWTRLYSSEPDSTACAVLQEVLDALRAERMVMGHTVQGEGIQRACDGRAWLIDTGLAAHYGGPLEILEIVGDSVRVVRESRPGT
jgi:hypothetical protein